MHADPVRRSLADVPVAFFATTMGLGGLALALHAAEQALGLAPLASRLALAVAALVWLLLIAVQGLRLIRHPQAVAAEWAHPVKIAFFPAITISALLIATGLAAEAPGLARVLWLLAAAGQGALTLAVLSAWIGHRTFHQMHLSPAWFIPAVGNVVAPLAGVGLGFPELSWLFFSAGLVFWIVLLALVMNRLVFHDPLPARLLPTLAILVAPPAVGMLAWLALTAGVDAMARILLNAGYVFAALVAVQAPKFRRLPFALSWWALSFPVAALASASLRFGALTGSAPHVGIGLALVTLLLAVVAGLVLRTAAAIRAGEICRPEEAPPAPQPA